jgi:hypothetical protein
MTDLATQLRNYLDGTAREVLLSEVRSLRTVRPVPQEAADHRRRWLIGAAAAAGALVAIVLTLLLWPGGGNQSAPFVDDGSTVPSTTVTVPTTTAAVSAIVAAPIPAEGVSPSPYGPLEAVSARESWTFVSVPVGTDASTVQVGHLEDGTWTLWRLTPSEREEGEPRDLAVAPDGTVWAATDVGVFSFDGEGWTRRFDDPAWAVAIDDLGAVWISSGGPVGRLDEGEVALARWDGESWERVVWPPEQSGGRVVMAALPNGEVWVTRLGYSSCGTGPLMRYDGAALAAVQVGDRPFRPSGGYVFEIEAAPNGDLWVGGYIRSGDPSYQPNHFDPSIEPPVLARFDGEAWTVYDWPLPNPMDRCYDPLLDMAVGPDGVVWLAYPDGLGSFDGTQGTLYIEGAWVYAVDVAPDGTVWYSDEQGVHTLTP